MTNKYLSGLLFALFLLLGLGCEEVPPVLNPGGDPNDEVPVEDQKRQVLIEEFTGERCVNCPAGSAAIEALLGVHGQRLVAVSIHAGFFAVPFPESDAQLANSTGESLLTLLDEPNGFPTAVVNRREFDGEESLQVVQAAWAGHISNELLPDPTVKIDLQSEYNDATGEVDIQADLYVVENIDYEDVRLTVYITENNVSDPQTTPNGTDFDYIHKHVFRAAVSAFDGDAINESMPAGSVVNRSFSITLDPSWVPSECHVVGFVHRGGGTQDVIQAHEVAVVE